MIGISVDQTVSEDEAIALISDMEISKRQYTCLLKLMENKGLSGFFPSQNRILSREKELLPQDKILSSQFKCEIDVEFLVMSTMKSILKQDEHKLQETLLNSPPLKIEFCIKLGTFCSHLIN